MKIRTTISLLLTLLTMVLVPVLTVFAVLGGDALGLMLIFTFVLNPIVSVVIGILSGWGEKVQWYLSLVNAVVYFIASIAIMGFDISQLVVAVVYLALGIVSAYITNGIRKCGAGK